MPFIEQWRRDVIDKHGLEGLAEVQPGDRCYVHYSKFVGAWRKEPRWTTAHNLCKSMFIDLVGKEDDDTSLFLAWEVFFNLHVMPYEQMKREQNGDI